MLFKFWIVEGSLFKSLNEKMGHLWEFYNFITFREFVYFDKNPISFRRMDSVGEKSVTFLSC